MSNTSQSWDPNLYQSSHAFVWQKAADLLELLAPQPGERILDVGCGTGQLTAQIAEKGADVEGIDRSVQMIDQARMNFRHLRFEVGDATKFEVEAPFDAVFSNATLHWVKPPEAAVERIYAALKPGGRFVAEFGGKGNVGRISAALRVALRDVAGVDFNRISPWFYPSIGEYAGMLERQGFDVSFATLFDRPTPLANGDAGLADWIRMFAAGLLEAIEPAKRQAVIDAACGHAKPDLFRDGLWIADYRRLRVVARRLQ